MQEIKYKSESDHLLRCLLTTSSITLTFLLIAHVLGQHEHTKDIATMGLVVLAIHLAKYLMFIEPTVERQDEED